MPEDPKWHHWGCYATMLEYPSSTPHVTPPPRSKEVAKLASYRVASFPSASRYTWPSVTWRTSRQVFSSHAGKFCQTFGRLFRQTSWHQKKVFCTACVPTNYPGVTQEQGEHEVHGVGVSSSHCLLPTGGCPRVSVHQVQGGGGQTSNDDERFFSPRLAHLTICRLLPG